MPPVVIAGAVAAAGAIGASALSAKSNSKAIKQSTQAQADSTAAQLGYQREADARNLSALTPFMARGNQAGDTIMAALGLGGSVTAPQATALPGTITSPYTGPNPSAMVPPGMGGALNPAGSPMFEYPANGPAGAYPTAATTQAIGPAGATPQSPAQAAASAYELFKESTGYQSRLTEGMRALNANFAGRGVLQSGAAVKSALRYGQDYASNEFGTWLGALGNQQGLGFAGASALAGVSQGSADRLGQISQSAADNTSNAAIARAGNQSALYTGVAGAVGNVAGALSSYRAPSPAALPYQTGAVIPNYGYA